MLARKFTCVWLVVIFHIPMAQASDPVRLGLLHTLPPAPFFIAQDRGYFKSADVDLTFRFYEAAQPVAAAVASGEVDIGETALTGGFFNLAQKGKLKIIGGSPRERKGCHGSAVFVSNHAFNAGLQQISDLPGHSFAITQYGSSFHYMLGRIAEAEGFDIKSIMLRPHRQISSMVDAVAFGQVDAMIGVSPSADTLVLSRQLHNIGWISDLIPYQASVIFVRTPLISNRPDVLRHLIDAYRLGVADYQEAFFRRDANGGLIIDDRTEAVITILANNIFAGDAEARQKILSGVGCYDASGVLDVNGVLEQGRWFKSQGLAGYLSDPAALFDTQFFDQR